MYAISRLRRLALAVSQHPSIRSRARSRPKMARDTAKTDRMTVAMKGAVGIVSALLLSPKLVVTAEFLLRRLSPPKFCVPVRVKNHRDMYN